MSTYGVIARRTATGFVGRLHQNVGNPHILGKALFRLRNGHFQGDTASMLRVLIDEHPAGWSDITNKDFTLAPGFVLKRPYLSMERYLALPDAHQPQCYCHGERNDPPVTFTEENIPMDATFLYLIDEVSHTMEIHLYRWTQWQTTGAPERLLIGSVALDGLEPSWSRYRSERIFYAREEWEQLQRRTGQEDLAPDTLPGGSQWDTERQLRLSAQQLLSALEVQTMHVVIGWLYFASSQKSRCQECGGPSACFMFDHFGYDGIELDHKSWREEPGTAEAGQSIDAVKLGTRLIQKLHQAQLHGTYRVSASIPWCDSCLADFIDAYLGEDDSGASAVALLRSSGGPVSCVLAWEVHSEEAKNLDFPRLFYTGAQTIDQLQVQFHQINIR